MCAVLLGFSSISCTAIIEGDAPGAGTTGTAESSGGTSAAGSEGTKQQVGFAQCAVCHGSMGEGTVLGYELQHPVREYARWVVRNGRMGPDFPNSVMVPFSAQSLDAAALDSILDFLGALEQPTTGQGLYMDYCANCHGKNARGGAVGKDIFDKGFNDALESVRKGAGGNNFAMRMTYMPAFSAAVLSDDEVRSITDYMATL